METIEEKDQSQDSNRLLEVELAQSIETFRSILELKRGSYLSMLTARL